MTAILRTSIAVLLLFAAAGPGTAYAQDQVAAAATPAAPSPSVDRGTLATGAGEFHLDEAAFTTAPLRQGGGTGTSVAIGAIIGGIAGLGATYLAADRYGNNEGGEFCTQCFLQWSLVGVPVGAAAGAAIGWGIGRARRSVTAVPVISRKTTGMVVVARF